MTRPTITLVNDSDSEQATRDLLLELFEEYGLERYLYAETVQIEEGVIPHSHPVLTLNTRPLNVSPPNRELLLATYIHEQMHWFTLLEANDHGSKQARKQFERMYPDLPVALPEGCGSQFSNYTHIMVNWLEYKALSELLGKEKAAHTAMNSHGVYTSIYKLVSDNDEAIEAVMAASGLLLPERPPINKRFRDMGLKPKN